MGSEIVMNVKKNDKQANRTTEDKTSDPTFDENKFLTNCLTVAFDEIFCWRKFFCCTVSPFLSILQVKLIIGWHYSFIGPSGYYFPPVFGKHLTFAFSMHGQIAQAAEDTTWTNKENEKKLVSSICKCLLYDRCNMIVLYQLVIR